MADLGIIFLRRRYPSPLIPVILYLYYRKYAVPLFLGHPVYYTSDLYQVCLKKKIDFRNKNFPEKCMCWVFCTGHLLTSKVGVRDVYPIPLDLRPCPPLQECCIRLWDTYFDQLQTNVWHIRSECVCISKRYVIDCSANNMNAWPVRRL